MTCFSPPAIPFIRNSYRRRQLPARTERGISLITVMVMMVLSLLLVLGGSRIGLLNERVSGNSTDYQRAYEAAEALLTDARLDLSCIGTCATRNAATQLPENIQAFRDLQATLAVLNPPCRDGICLNLGNLTSGDPATSFWNNTALWTTFTTNNVGVRFGQYTGTAVAAGQAVNPLLINGAWYWIEVIEYTDSAQGKASWVDSRLVAPNQKVPFVYRITAAAQGRRTGTVAVLQALHYFPDPNN